MTKKEFALNLLLLGFITRDNIKDNWLYYYKYKYHCELYIISNVSELSVRLYDTYNNKIVFVKTTYNEAHDAILEYLANDR